MPLDSPHRLQPGDVVKASFQGLYLNWTVRSVHDLDADRQTVTASSKGQGSVRFEWIGGHLCQGSGHGMRFHFKSRPVEDPRIELLRRELEKHRMPNGLSLTEVGKALASAIAAFQASLRMGESQ